VRWFPRRTGKTKTYQGVPLLVLPEKGPRRVALYSMIKVNETDGTWSKAEPLPYYYDNRCTARRIFDVLWGLLTFQWLTELAE
jgi:hypothetical protein